MEVNEMVCNLQQAHKLKELGLRQDTYFAWLENYSHPVFSGRDSENFIAAAYTSSELGKILGMWTKKVTPNHYGLFTFPESYFYMPSLSAYRSEAQARADMLISLIEKGHFGTIEDMNIRLGFCSPG